MKDFIEKYFTGFANAIENIVVTDSKNMPVDFTSSIEKINALLLSLQSNNKKVVMIGNGGSAGICSHQAVDYWKNGNIKAVTFNDSSLLTCISNDFSYAEVFSKPIEMFAEEGDMVYCISSSGKSVNILNAAKAAKEKKCDIITFSGFDDKNPLRQEGVFNFYIPNYSYGMVEILHLFIIHAILDAKLYCNDKVDIFNQNNKMQ
ncbi:MAG: SIS domain-containing protein [Bacteroidia bacterium]|nr:SIS domain-containing protein [Bacteroidia bacterium]